MGKTNETPSCISVADTGDFTHFFIALAAVKELRNMPIMNVELLKLSLSLRIRASRKMLGLNQKDFSKECGLDRSYFGGVERGQRNLTFSSLCQICEGLKCDIAAVTKGIPHPTDTPK
jgi:DNA-binding XRE family transcriptional regulator